MLRKPLADMTAASRAQRRKRLSCGVGEGPRLQGQQEEEFKSREEASESGSDGSRLLQGHWIPKELRRGHVGTRKAILT